MYIISENQIVGNNNDNKRVRPWVQTIIDSGDAVKAAKYANQMTADERSKVNSSIKVMQGIQNTAKENNNSSNGNSSSNSTKSTNYKSYFHEEQKNPTVDSWADVRSHTQQTTQQKSQERASEILKDYPETKTGESQKMTDEEIKRKYNRH